MKSMFETFGTDSSAEVEGVWQDFGTFKALLARSGGRNTFYNKTLDEEVKKLGKATLAAVSSEEADALVSKVFAKVCIKDHKVKDADGKWKKGTCVLKDGKEVIVPFTVENMQTTLSLLPDYYDELRKSANDFTTYQAEVEKETIKK